jgi:hypothetical protein
MPIDTLKAARRLQEEGVFDEDQAERIAEVISDFGAASARKEDLNELEERLTGRIGEAKKELRKELETKELETAEKTKTGPVGDDSDAFDTDYLDEIKSHEEPIIARSTPLLNRVGSAQLARLLVGAARDESGDWRIFSEFVAEGPDRRQHHYFLLEAAATSTHTPDYFLVRLGQRETVLQSVDHRLLAMTLADWTADYGEEDVLWDPDGLASENPPVYFREDHSEREPPDVVRRPYADDDE